MLSFLLAALFFSDLPKPVKQKETTHIVQCLPLSPGREFCYRVRGRILARFIRKDMTQVQVEQLLGPSLFGGVDAGVWWRRDYYPFGVSVTYEIENTSVAGNTFRSKESVSKVHVSPLILLKPAG